MHTLFLQIAIKPAEGGLLRVGDAWRMFKANEATAMPREMLQALDVAMRQVRGCGVIGVD